MGLAGRARSGLENCHACVSDGVVAVAMIVRVFPRLMGDPSS